MPHSLEILLGDRRVGTITNLENDQNVFVFHDDYQDDRDRPILSLGFYNVERELVVPTRLTKTRLLPFFANLLPESHLREYLAEQGHVNPGRDFPLLWLLGADLPGAVIARHADGALPPAEQVVSEAVVRDPKVLKFSLAGLQLKFSAVMEASGGLTIPVHGRGGHWIVKMPSATYSLVPENEYTMLAFARRVGIEVPEFGLIETKHIANLPSEVRRDLGKALFVKRFDRDGDKRIHIEDFAQIFRIYPDDKYKFASYGNMLTGIWRAVSEEDTKEFIRRLVFTIAIGNADMHLKNWSLIYRDGITPRLAPAYDYLSTIDYIQNDKLALNIVRTKEWSDVDLTLLERFARKAGVPRGIVVSAAEEMVDRILQEWGSLNEAGLLPASMIRTIDDHLKRLPLFTRSVVSPGREKSQPLVSSTDSERVEIA